MSKVKQFPSGSYRAQVYLGKDETGKRKFASVTAPTKTQAELKAAQLKNERKSAQFHSMTVSEAVSRYPHSPRWQRGAIANFAMPAYGRRKCLFLSPLFSFTHPFC